ncbi:uncharacterized protein DUF441 [Hazenella coriacea]|uniref:Uncharacterized protein DUF441 n=2 Tax=Hazenella coriacea TaxID=1179467 RepID=A0A4R3L4L6_9BACL|nr:uncharacterized protein DUF441 [Hazenella coriacea]
MLFLLVPLTNDKLNIWDMLKQSLSPMGAIAITAGFVISYLGGKGLGVLSSKPITLFGIILGTLIAVLFFRGLPAGIIIAAGLLSLMSITSS